MSPLFVSCTPGLEGVLALELAALGVGRVERVEGGAEVSPLPLQLRAACEVLNRRSRIGSRVLWRIASAASPAELPKVSLREFLKSDGRVRVAVSGARDRAWQAAAQRAWGASAGEGAAALDVDIRVVDGVASVSVDTSGEPLHFRGYRQEIGRAPMRETLAAGVLALANWRGDEPLWDVMCGSGTIVIEAAELALGLAPGRNRGFAFDAFADSELPRAPMSFEAEPGRPWAGPITGSDLNAGALGTARRNAKRAGVLERLTLLRLDATKLSGADRPLAPGLVIANLPYGRRVGERSGLGRLYRELGASLRRACPGWRFAFLLEEGAERLGLEITSRHALSNGGIRCELVQGRLTAARTG